MSNRQQKLKHNRRVRKDYENAMVGIMGKTRVQARAMWCQQFGRSDAATFANPRKRRGLMVGYFTQGRTKSVSVAMGSRHKRVHSTLDMSTAVKEAGND